MWKTKSLRCFLAVTAAAVCLTGCASSEPPTDTTTTSGTTVITTATIATSSTTVVTTTTTTGGQTVSKTDTTTTATTTATSSTVSQTTTAVTTSTAPAEEHFQSIAVNDERIAYLNRAKPTVHSTVLDWSGSGFELEVRGGTVKANLSGPTTNRDAAVWVAVYVDGKRTQKFPLKEGIEEWYTLAVDLPTDKVTEIRVVKLSEASWGQGVLQGVKVSGELLKPTLPDRRILWIGDSITCGFGVLGKKSTEPFSTRTQDVTLTYGWLLSDAFNAQRHIISVSGYGVATANTGSTTDGLIPKIYPQTGFHNTDGWDHAQYQPDLIVVNLGTNDVYGGTDAATLRGGVRSFLTQLRAAHPSATIVWVYGLMRDDFSNDIQAEVEAFAQTDSAVHFLPAAVAKGSAEIGSADHPSDDAHARLADTLKPQLRTIMGW